MCFKGTNDKNSDKGNSFNLKYVKKDISIASLPIREIYIKFNIL